jgi:hypothetical protein
MKEQTVDAEIPECEICEHHFSALTPVHTGLMTAS